MLEIIILALLHASILQGFVNIKNFYDQYTLIEQSPDQDTLIEQSTDRDSLIKNSPNTLIKQLLIILYCNHQVSVQE